MREFKLLSSTPREASHGDDESQMVTWSFTYHRTGYAETHNPFEGVEGMPRSSGVQLWDAR